MSAERDHRRAYLRRIRVYLRAAAFLLGALLVLASSLHGQEHPRSMDRPLVLWADPPVIGVDSQAVERVYDTLPAIATAEWPEFTDSVLTELEHCTGLKPPKAWQVRTVAAPAFTVDINVRGKWYNGQPFIGYTFTSVHRIYVVQFLLRSPRLVRHEWLHALMYDNGLDPRHGTPIANALFKKCAPEDK